MHLIDPAAETKMKATAYLTKSLRDPVVDEAAAFAAQKSGWIAGAGLDEPEPDLARGLSDFPQYSMDT
jgi:lactate dehydrogenase-like 2-hydroxyacid dehydrogenase